MAELTINDNANADQLNLVLSGRLDMDSVAKLWQSCFDAVKQFHPKQLIVNASAIDYCDSAGISLLLELKKQQEKTGQFALEGLAEKFQQMLNIVEKIPFNPKEDDLAELEKLNSVEHVGRFAIDVLKQTKENVIYLGELCYEMARGFSKPAYIRWKDVWRVVEATGPNSLPIIALLGFLVGLIISFQSAIPLKKFGALVFIANLVGIGLTRELAPLMVSIILAGRTASSFAAEIGTMKVNQEIDALKTMGLRPLLFLAIPRVIAVMLMAPVLNLFMIAFGLLGCGLFMATQGYGWHIFYHHLNTSVTMGDVFGGLFKTVVFGLVIAGIGCMYGLRTAFGASAVGVSTTKAVVSCIIMITILDGIFAVLFYAIGI